MLLIIDLQKNFINEYTKEVLLKIEKLLSKNIFDYVAFTKFINDTNSQFCKILNYKGCIDDEDRKIVIDTKNYPIFDKRIYTTLNLEFKIFLEKNNIKTIYLCGIDTDACVLKTAVDLFENNYDVKVIEGNIFSSHIGGYASFANNPYMNYSTYEGSYIYIGSDLDEVFKLGNAMSFYVLISKENLRDKKFAEATCNFEWS